MDREWKDSVWRQFGAAIDMLDNAMAACPDALWADRAREPECWYLAYHTLFWLDLYLSGPVGGFAPPAPFGLEELDPAGLIPERPYTKAELRAYLAHCREKCRATIAVLTRERARERFAFGWGEAGFAELLLYNMRHVQHGAAQLNLILRQETDSAPRWVAAAPSLPVPPPPSLSSPPVSTNIEIKARVADAVALEAAVAALPARGPQVIAQEDVFFTCPEGHLKLRVLGPDRGELIRYAREEGERPRASRYTIAPTPDPAALRAILAATLGELGAVRKTRRLYLAGQTRVHLDRVEGLGDFLELEVVLRAGQPADEGEAIVRDLMRRLGVAADDLMAETYFDLLRARQGMPDS